MRDQVYYLNTDHIIELETLTNGLTGAVINGATVTCTVYDADDTEVSGESWPVTLTEDGSTGTYRGALSDALSVSNTDRLTAKVTATSSGLTRTWFVPVVVQKGM